MIYRSEYYWIVDRKIDQKTNVKVDKWLVIRKDKQEISVQEVGSVEMASIVIIKREKNRFRGFGHVLMREEIKEVK